LFPDSYAGADGHPLELVFFKTNRNVAPEVHAGVRTQEKGHDPEGGAVLVEVAQVGGRS
jgi:hypothetical protein